MSRRSLENVLPLAAFLHRGRVLDLYRQTLKAVRRLEASPAERVQLSQHIREQYRKNIDVEPAERRTLLVYAERELNFLRSGSRKATSTEDSDMAGYTRGGWNDPALQQADDVKGRVGEGWPWSNK